LNFNQDRSATSFVRSPQEQSCLQTNIFSFVKDLRKIHEAILSRAFEREITFKLNLKVTAELREGDYSSQIVETAFKNQFDLIVVGQRGARKINELFLGITSERVTYFAR